MKQLLLMRHAKSDWADPSLDDFDRPLNDRGNKAAPAMGKYIQDQGFAPQLILCSAAQRTKQTAAHLLDTFSDAPTIDYLQALYLSTPDDIFRIVKTVSADIDKLMVVAHNPGMHSLAITLAHHSFPGQHEAMVWNFPTAALAVYDLNIESWDEIGRECSRLVDYMVPKALPG